MGVVVRDQGPEPLADLVRAGQLQDAEVLVRLAHPATEPPDDGTARRGRALVAHGGRDLRVVLSAFRSTMATRSRSARAMVEGRASVAGSRAACLRAPARLPWPVRREAGDVASGVSLEVEDVSTGTAPRVGGVLQLEGDCASAQ